MFRVAFPSARQNISRVNLSRDRRCYTTRNNCAVHHVRNSSTSTATGSRPSQGDWKTLARVWISAFATLHRHVGSKSKTGPSQNENVSRTGMQFSSGCLSHVVLRSSFQGSHCGQQHRCGTGFLSSRCRCSDNTTFKFQAKLYLSSCLSLKGVVTSIREFVFRGILKGFRHQTRHTCALLILRQCRTTNERYNVTDQQRISLSYVL
jgi:hypothetical protein